MRIKYDKCTEYNPLHEKANELGMVTFWRAYIYETEACFYGSTKGDVNKQIKRYSKMKELQGGTTK